MYSIRTNKSLVDQIGFSLILSSLLGLPFSLTKDREALQKTGLVAGLTHILGESSPHMFFFVLSYVGCRLYETLFMKYNMY